MLVTSYMRLMSKNKRDVRQIAYKKIYLVDKEDYSLPFEGYDIHHKDRDKDNKAVDNLDIVTRDEHKQIHNLGLRGKKELCEYLHREQKSLISREEFVKLKWI
ncbi:hypothetical protein CMI49_01320 [Candidatus Pacearchaeota archaeon]|nr:hypothetical protein [Candidatus Pacearchaeota archaeon]